MITYVMQEDVSSAKLTCFKQMFMKAFQVASVLFVK